MLIHFLELCWKIQRGLHPTISYFYRVFGQSKLYGNAQWMGRLERRIRYSPERNKGIYLSPKYRLSLWDSLQHVTLEAASGGFKTVSGIIPSLLLLDGPSLVVMDPSGEIFKATSGHFRAKGYHIQVFQPLDLSSTQQFNPVSAWFRQRRELREIVQDLGRDQVGEGSQQSPSSQFWGGGGTSLLYLLLRALVNKGVEELIHLGNVSLLVDSFGVRGEGVQGFCQEYLDERDYLAFESFCAQSPETLSGRVETAKVALGLWQNPNIVKLTAKHTIDFEALRNKKSVLYINIQEDRIKDFPMLWNLFFSSLFDYCKNSKGNNIFFFLDEFANLGNIKGFKTTATTVRKFGISLILVIQDRAQLRDNYGKEIADIILGGATQTKIFFPGLEQEPTEYVSKRLGTTTVTGNVPDREQEGKMRRETIGRPLMRPDEVRMMEIDEVKGLVETVIISKNRKPMRVKLQDYRKNPRLLRMSRKRPATVPFSATGEVAWLDLKVYRKEGGGGTK